MAGDPSFTAVRSAAPANHLRGSGHLAGRMDLSDLLASRDRDCACRRQDRTQHPSAAAMGSPPEWRRGDIGRLPAGRLLAAASAIAAGPRAHGVRLLIPDRAGRGARPSAACASRRSPSSRSKRTFRLSFEKGGTAAVTLLHDLKQSRAGCRFRYSCRRRPVRDVAFDVCHRNQQ